MLDLSESGGDIAEKLFVLLDEKQQKELTSYVITRNIQDCSFSGRTSLTGVAVQHALRPALTEILS